MTIIYNNGKIVGCEQKGHSLIMCHDCIVTDVADCPCQQQLLKQIEDDRYVPDHKVVSNPYEEVALEIAKLVSRKQKEYGDSFGNSHKIFEVLYPEGVKPEQMKDFLVIVRIVDKLFRIARGDQGEESAWDDIHGYSNLASVRVRKEKGVI